MNDITTIKTILAKLISFRTVAQEKKEIELGFSYIKDFFKEDPIETKIFSYEGSVSQMIFFNNTDWKTPTILLNAHLDVVPSGEKEAFNPIVKGLNMYGRGASDMKGPLTAFLIAMKELSRLPSIPSVALLITSDEETGGEKGAGYMVRQGLRSKFIINGDGAQKNPSIILNRARGVLWLGLSAKGKSAHGARPWLGENAVQKVIEAVQKVQAYVGPIKPGAWSSTVNLSWIESVNRTPNIVPDSARAVLDIRFTEDLARSPKELLAAIRKLVPEAKVVSLNTAPFFITKESNNFVKIFTRTVENLVNKKAIFGFDEGSNDGRFFAEKNIPVIVVGAGGGDRHGKKEWVPIRNVEIIKNIVVQFVKQI